MKSRLAAAFAASLVAAAVAAIPLATADTVSDPQGEVCSVPGFPAPVKLTTQVDTDAPDEIFAGTTREVAVTSLVTLPAEVVDSLRADGATSVGGTSDAVVSVSNADRDATLAITPAALPAATGTPLVL